MAGNKWTGEQLRAITERDCSLLVAAAAGAGKTAVLVERIIRRITDAENPVDIDRLLVVTFTNAAAAEMKERIADAISAALEGKPGSKNIQRQLTLLNKASITTIHSFCLEVIRGNFQSINIDPGFRIADETEALLLKLEALNELFEDQYDREANEDFSELLECYGGNRDDQALQDLVLNIYGFIQSSPWPLSWLEEMTESFNAPPATDFCETRWGRVLLDSVRVELEGARDMMARAAGALNTAEGLEAYRAVCLEDLSGIGALLVLYGGEAGGKTWDSLFRAFQSLEFAALPRCGREADRERQEYVKKIRDEVKTRLRRIRDRVFSADSSEALEDMRAMYPVIKCLAELVASFGERYAAKKSRRSLVDFNDLEHFCLEILSGRDENGGLIPAEAARAYRERFDEILVDEYQDSNLVQEIIIGMISRVDEGRPNVFMVGDVKQSIYRFRQARPELFLSKYSSYSGEKDSLFRKILLFRNFRSRREVVEAVNFIFKQIMSERVGELDYTDTEALNPGAVFAECEGETELAGGKAELHLIQTGAGAGDRSAVDEAADGGEADAGGGVEDPPDNMQCEARLAAKRIRELLHPDARGREFVVYDKRKKKYRKAEYRDIVILLRTTRNWAEVFMEELSNQGIPAFADTGTGFFKTTEIQVILSLLQVIDNPLQDIPLLSVLRSPIAAFTSDELAELRLAEPRGPLYGALQKLADGGKEGAPAKAAVFLDKLQEWRYISLYMSTERLLWHLYNDTGYYGTAGAMPAGEQRQANLRILFERARQFEATSYKGLFNFISFVDRLKSGKGDMGSAKILGENDNVVRIMSIHKSKGLEFPVVILAGCGKRFNLQDMNKSILLHQELGFGPDVVEHRRRLSYPSVPKQAIREKIKAETLSEEMRILYVALTRAREKLIITGSTGDVRKAAAKWAQCSSSREYKLPAYEMRESSSFLDWIGPALMRHRSCGALRDIADAEGILRELLLDDPSSWCVRLWNKSDMLSKEIEAERDEHEFIRWLDSLAEAGTVDEPPEEISARLSWEYPYAEISAVPAKVSVTELKRRFDTALSEETGAFPEYLPALIRKPLFLEERKGLSAAEAGTVLHFVMQHLEYAGDDLEAQLEEMVARALLTEQQAQSVDTGKIRRFLESPLGKRLLAAGSINREVPFNIEIPCRELYGGMEDENCRNETLLLQGVIDCFFEEPDGLVLLDYKTDYVAPGRIEAVRERYGLQIGYYARALEMLTGKSVKEKYIYLFRSGEALEF